MRPLLPLLTLAALLAKPLPPVWRNWRYSRPIGVEASGVAVLVNAMVPLEVYSHAQDKVADLRVIDDQGREVPYVLYARLGQNRHEWRAVHQLETGFSPGQYTQTILDTGPQPQLHNSVALDTPARDFFVRVEAAVSDDARAWRILRHSVPVYRFRKDNIEGNQRIFYGETNARYLRLRILEGSKQFPLGTYRLAYELTEEAERVPLQVSVVGEPEAPRDQSVWKADFGDAPQPISEVRFQVSQPTFYRRVEVGRSDDGKTWDNAGGGDIYRINQGDRTVESLSITFGESRARYWRVAMMNRSDPPLEDVRLVVYGTPRHVIFREEPGRRYWLLYGNSQVKPPQYEMARSFNWSTLQTAASARADREELNSGYKDPRPWSERHPRVLWVALGTTVALLGLLAIQSLRQQS